MRLCSLIGDRRRQLGERVPRKIFVSRFYSPRTKRMQPVSMRNRVPKKHLNVRWFSR
jgi:hypothetical protein